MAGGWFRRSSEALAQVRATGDRLGVFTLTLTGVEDPFDADPLWDRRYGGGSQIAEGLTGDRDFRLQAALDGCRNTVFERDEAGRFRETNPIFTDVVAWVAKPVWRAEAMRGGGHLEALEHALCALHEEKFSRSLPGNRSPRYTVMADRRLSESQVAFQFGFGVYVPGEGDILDAEIGLLRPRENDTTPLPPFHFWRGGAQVQRPVGVYRGQRSLLISGSDDGPIRPAVWFRGVRGNVLVNLNEADAERVYADCDEIRVVSSRKPESQPGAIEWRLDALPPAGERETLWMRVTPVAPELGARLPPDGRPVADEPRVATAPGASPPAEADETPLSARYSLHLAGLGLFRVDPARLPGLEEWVIWLDELGWPLRERDMGEGDEASCPALRMRSGSGHLEFRRGAGADFEPVGSLPCAIETARGQKLELLRPAVPDRYAAMLLVEDGLVLPVSPSALSLGRATQTDQAEPDLPVQLLDHPRSTRWAEGTRPSLLDAIELSRRHVSVQLQEERLAVSMAKGSTPAFMLDEELAVLSRLDPRASQVVHLVPGQHLLVGHYLFRFQREKALAVAPTASHTIPVPPS